MPYHRGTLGSDARTQSFSKLPLALLEDAFLTDGFAIEFIDAITDFFRVINAC
jgi:hypothetical protein